MATEAFGWLGAELRTGASGSTLSSLGLGVEPGFANFFPLSVDSQSVHEIRNDSSKRIAFKTTCSNNVSYRVRPVCSVVEPGKCVALTIGRLSGGLPRNDLLCLHFILLSTHDPDPQPQLFLSRKPDGCLQLPLLATHTPMF